MHVSTLLQLALLPLVVSAVEKTKSEYTLREVGARNTVEWRMWLEKSGNPISPWHDVPLYPDPTNNSIINMVVEIPRWSDGKIEIKRDEPLNPFFHDDKDNKARFVASFWPHKSYPFLYGSIPQSWESVHVADNFTTLIGDNDPVDIFDISSISPGNTGLVKKVKILGGLAMIDDNTTDWKAIAVDVLDPLAALVDTVQDVDKLRPGLTTAFHGWFKYYKVARGKGLNKIQGDSYVDAATMRAKIAESHHHWQELISGKQDKGEISVFQTSDDRQTDFVKPEEATKRFKIPKKTNVQPAAAKPAPYNRWYYLDGKFNLITLPGDVVEVE